MPIGFLLKKIFLYLLYPSGLVFLLLLGVSVYALWGKRRGRRRAFLFMALFLYYLASTPFLPYFLLQPLEAGLERPPIETLRGVDYLVVLPARIYGAPGLYLEERFSRETLARWLAAVRLKKALPKAHLLVVGGSWEGPGSVYLAELSREFGVEAEFLDTPRDTISSVEALKTKLSRKRFVIITSAHHLRRTLYLFRRAGLEPIPYPAVYLSHQSRFRPFHVLYLLPDPVYLEITDEAVHEYLGLIFYHLRDLLWRRGR
ncbi:MAG: hypothetical protein DSZ24_04830 [Thermodesulfatator sp.]|nr:MAG: hypothetical protein DSZ24_04830 [Thermodesulfatator sp.]